MTGLEIINMFADLTIIVACIYLISMCVQNNKTRN